MMRFAVFLYCFVSFAISQNEIRRDKFISIHVGEPIYLSFSMHVLRSQRVKLFSGIGTSDLIGYQDYGLKYNDKYGYFFYRRGMIILNNSNLQFKVVTLLDNLFDVHVNMGLQTRFISRFVYSRLEPLYTAGLRHFVTPSKNLIELLPFLQLGLSYTSTNRRYIYGANVGMAKNVFPIVWKLEPMADVYIGMNLLRSKNR